MATARTTLPDNTTISDIYNSDPSLSLENVGIAALGDYLPLVDYDKDELRNVRIEQMAETLDKSVILTRSASSGAISKKQTFVLANSADTINFVLDAASITKLSDGQYIKDSGEAAGLTITVVNSSTKVHTVTAGTNTWAIPAKSQTQFYWTGAAWTLYTTLVDSLTVTGSASFGGTIGGSGITSLLSDYYNKQSVDGLLNKRIMGIIISPKINTSGKGSVYDFVQKLISQGYYVLGTVAHIEQNVMYDGDFNFVFDNGPSTLGGKFIFSGFCQNLISDNTTNTFTIEVFTRKGGHYIYMEDRPKYGGNHTWYTIKA